jgi:hypothetical protein
VTDFSVVWKKKTSNSNSDFLTVPKERMQKWRQKMKRKWMTMLCVCSLVFCVLTGCSSNSQTAENTATPEPTQETVVDYNEDETSNLGQWARAMGSVLIYLNDGNPYYFGGYQATEDNQKAAVNILSTSWEINSREDLLSQVKLLLQTGDRKTFLKEAKEMNRMSKKDLKTAMKQLSGDLLVHYRMVRYNWKNWKKNGLLAWDMCRISHLVQWGYVAGYLDCEEAQALMEPAVKKLKKNFSSWDEVQNNWLDGYCYYADVDYKASHTDYTNRKALYETLKAEQTDEKLLYDDSLFTSEIIPLSGVSYRTILEEKKTTDTKTKDTKTQDTKAKDTKTENANSKNTKTENTNSENTKTQDTQTKDTKK